jgi:hypothetical protein
MKKKKEGKNEISGVHTAAASLILEPNLKNKPI